MLKKLFLPILILGLSFFVTACDSAEERAQKHFEKGMELLEAGDVDRALVEFRNVFKLNGEHKEARIAYAEVQEERGDLQQAYSQYLRLIEQYPENLEGRRALTRLAAGLNDWEEAERHVSVAEKMAPEDPVILSVRAGLDYRNAIRNQDQDIARMAVKVSETLLQDNPDLPTARQIVIDDLLRREDWAGALEAIDAGLAIHESRGLYMMRLGVLEQMGLEDEIFAQLKQMEESFPASGARQMLVGRYIAQDRLDEAEAYLRARVDSGAENAIQELVSFLSGNRGAEEAIAEIDTLLAGSPEQAALLRSARAELDFRIGNRDAALLEVEDILKAAEPSEETDRIKILYARMLIQTGNSVGACAQVEEVLERDPGQLDAVKLKAAWLIEDDKPGDALVDLREALNTAPQDAVLMSLMAQAHERTGNHDLMGEMLAMAVEASGNDPQMALRYAQYLVQEERFLPAEDILKEALRRQSENLQLLSALGGLYVQMEDWARTQQVIDRLQSVGTSQSQGLANTLTARKLASQRQAGQLEKFLSELEAEGSGLQASAAIVRLRMAQDDVDGALAYVDDLLVKNAGNPALRFLRANVLIAAGLHDEAEQVLVDLNKEFPQNERVWLMRYGLHASQGEADLATQVLSEAQAALPGNPTLKWTAAGEAENRGDIDGAIAIYEELYAENSNSIVIANNLASLISSYREDDAALQRAYEIARRLRGTEVPAFQDTYGWIAHRLGSHDEAREYLEPAAQALSTDPVVQFHLAENYAALGLGAMALEQYAKVVELVTEKGGARPPFMDKVDAEIARLTAEQN